MNDPARYIISFINITFSALAILGLFHEALSFSLSEVFANVLSAYQNLRNLLFFWVPFEIPGPLKDWLLLGAVTVSAFFLYLREAGVRILSILRRPYAEPEAFLVIVMALSANILGLLVAFLAFGEWREEEVRRRLYAIIRYFMAIVLLAVFLIGLNFSIQRISL